MTETQIHYILGETTRNHYTQIPNIVYELLEQGLISNSDFILYSVVRRIAGEKGGCWVGVRGLMKLTGLSGPTITKSKKSLSKNLSILGNIGLLKIIPGNKKEETADTIIVTDIWQVNDPYFQKKYTCENSRYRGVKKDDTGVCKITIQNNEPSNKNLCNKKSNSENVHKSKLNRLESPDPVPIKIESPPISTGSTLFSKKGSTDYSNPDYIELLDLETEYIKYFKPKIVARWITKFGVTQTLKTIKYYLKIHGGKEKIANPEAWMEKALKEDFTKADENAIENKSFAEKAKDVGKWRSLKINKRYCTELKLGVEIYYNLPKENFETQLKNLYDRYKINR
jgi:hypothetical protein